MAKMYEFERLKHFKGDYYSFNLGKNKGIIRLITEGTNDKCYFVYISFKHYKDFDERKVIYYD